MAVRVPDHFLHGLLVLFLQGHIQHQVPDLPARLVPRTYSSVAWMREARFSQDVRGPGLVVP